MSSVKSFYVCAPSGNKGPFSLDTLKTLHSDGRLPGAAKILRENGDVYPLEDLLLQAVPLDMPDQASPKKKRSRVRKRFDAGKSGSKQPDFRRARASRKAVRPARASVARAPVPGIEEFIVAINKGGLVYNITGLSGDELFAADLRKSALEDAADRIANGEAPARVLGKKATLVNVEDIRSIEVSEAESILHVNCRANKKEVVLLLQYRNLRERLEMLDQLRARLDGRIREAKEAVGFFAASGKSLLFVILGPFLTLMFYLAALDVASGAEVQISGRRQGAKLAFVALVDAFGPGGIVFFGLLFTLGSLGWMIYRLKNRDSVTRWIVGRG